MHDLNWDDLRFFLAVSERGSISGAAKLLNVNHSTVLRRLASLEKKLGARLFDRLPDGAMRLRCREKSCAINWAE
jgi:DNA-binding transcriptional LysR family regulator